jgi:EAL domain-containing protein (putative c-di-GMP-specific phosphodiesterase class I)
MSTARILIADDDDALRKLLDRALTRHGFTVTSVSDGKQALVALAGQTFDAIISDVQMPGSSGLELLREVRRIDLDVPLILMSGMPDVRSATTAVEYGAFRYLIKPFDFTELIHVVELATRAHALARIRREAHAVVSAQAASAVDRAGTEVRFDQAVAGMWLAFQPIVDRHGAPYGHEALMRSVEPSMSAPNQILDAATQLSKIATVGRRVRALATAGPTTGAMFVNLHPDDLFDDELLDPASPLTAIASRVVLEITERASLGSSPNLTARIARLRELGFRLAIDDIGAGYSGLTSFTEIMPEVVKIDMALVRDVHTHMLRQRTIAALCTLCHEVGTLVVGEGIEVADERDCLIELGCDLLQGYLIGRPARLG